MRLLRRFNVISLGIIGLWAVSVVAAVRWKYPDFWAEPYGYYQEARFFRERGRNYEALAVMDKALHRDPKNVGYLSYRGFLLLDSHQDAEAREAFRQALDLNADNDDARYGLIEVYRRQGQRHEMERLICEVRNPAPTDTVGLRRRGQVLSELGLQEQALTDLCQALDTEPASPGLLREAASAANAKGDWQKAIELYDQLIAISPEQTVVQQAQLGKGEALRALDRPQEALEAFGAAGPSALRPRAEVALQLERFADAEALYTQLATQRPDDPQVLADLAYAQEHNGHPAAAESTYHVLRSMGPLSATAAVRFAWLLDKRHAYAEALQVLNGAAQQTAEIDALRAQTHDWLRTNLKPNQILVALPTPPPAPAPQPVAAPQPAPPAAPVPAVEPLTPEQGLRQELAANPENHAARLQLAKLHLAAGRVAEAEAGYREVLKGNAGPAEQSTALLALADICEQHHRTAEAARLLARLSGSPGPLHGSPQLALRIGRLLQWNNRAAEALPWLERAAGALPPGQPQREARLRQGQALLDTRRPAEALPIFADLLQAQPDKAELLLDGARAASDAGQPAQAAAYLDRLATQRPLTLQESRWHAGMLRAAGRNNDARRAYAALEQSGEADPQSLEALGDLRMSSGDAAGALEAYHRLPQPAPAERAARDLKLARTAQAAGDRSEAEAAYRRAEAEAASPAVTLETARFFLSTGQPGKALPYLEQAAASAKDPALERQLAETYLSVGLHASAEAAAKRLLARDAADGQAALLLARAQHLQGRDQDADQTLARLGPSVASTPQALELRGYVAMAQDRHLEAYRLFEQLANRPGIAPETRQRALLWQAKAARMRGDLGRAEETLQQARELAGPR